MKSMFAQNTLNAIVISNKIQNKNSKTKALFVSLFMHSTLFAVTLYLASNSSLKPIIEEETHVVISLSNFVPSSKASNQPTQAIQKIEKNKEEKVVKDIKAPIKQTKIAKKAESKTLQKIAPKPISAVPSSEAFTPQTSNDASATNTDNKTSYSPVKSISDLPNALPTQNESSQIDPTTLGLIRALIQNSLVYPAMAKRLKIEGVVVVSFVLTRDGRVESATILNNSGSSSLDSKAIQTVLALSGEYPTLNKEVQLQIPIAFSLNKS
jgi:protein TonB